MPYTDTGWVAPIRLGRNPSAHVGMLGRGGFHLAAGQRARSRRPYSGARFETLAEAGHFPHLQTRETVAALALAFLRPD